MSTGLLDLSLQWATGRQFLADFEASRLGRLNVEVADRNLASRLKPGDTVSLSATLLDRRIEVRVFCSVLGPAQVGAGQRFRLELKPGQDERCWLLLGAAKGESVPYRRRRHPRTETVWQVTARDESGFKVRCSTTNLSEGGLGLSSALPLVIDATWRLSVWPRGRLLPLSLVGRLLWCQEFPSPYLYGVSLRFERQAERARWARLVSGALSATEVG